MAKDFDSAVMSLEVRKEGLELCTDHLQNLGRIKNLVDLNRGRE